MRSSTPYRLTLLAVAATLAAAPGFAAPAARANDRTTHAGTILGPASPDVFIEGRPAARRDDRVVCPLAPGGVPHVGGPILVGSGTVLINGRPAARAGDRVLEAGATSEILAGSETVRIGP